MGTGSVCENVQTKINDIGLDWPAKNSPLDGPTRIRKFEKQTVDKTEDVVFVQEVISLEPSIQVPIQLVEVLMSSVVIPDNFLFLNLE